MSISNPKHRAPGVESVHIETSAAPQRLAGRFAARLDDGGVVLLTDESLVALVKGLLEGTSEPVIPAPVRSDLGLVAAPARAEEDEEEDEDEDDEDEDDEDEDEDEDDEDQDEDDEDEDEDDEEDEDEDEEDSYDSAPAWVS